MRTLSDEARLSCTYRRRHPETTVLYEIVQQHLETFLARRTADTSAWLVDQLLPKAGYRQWVLTFPWTLRFRLAADRALLTTLLRVFLQVLFAWQRRRGRWTAATISIPILPRCARRSSLPATPHWESGQVPAWDREALERLLRYGLRVSDQ
ncbi:MAG: hypothetical protein KJ927_04460 [Candidatus Eisenbacteria bacterium]|nr:hypothetical protein [Candidatus Eisenbacteria bacterium]MBU1947941.1 hypothetical protein [Candidatus Eisenbacteria bacterium]